MTANQNHNSFTRKNLNFIDKSEVNEPDVSKLHKDNLSSLSSQPGRGKKINRTLERLKYFEDLEYRKILIMREINKEK
ncbi:MAG: hypothetical protein IPM56_13850 [Ignavibacteriales bacterium]|nr:MAG: hypothetical protein IPM56_13850 [Ignavibacteriales bacterium]